MKQITSFILLLLVLCLSACGIPFAEVEREDESSVADLESFSSVEEFTSAIEEGTDVAQLSSLKAYYVPQSIPAEYGLGKILAGAFDIAFYYYPVASLSSEETMMQAEAAQECFEFRFRRWDLDDPLSGIMEQLGKRESDLIDNKYLFDAPTKTYYWAQDGEALSMTLPALLDATTEEALSYCEAGTVAVSSYGG